jgi:hypothetical protein
MAGTVRNFSSAGKSEKTGKIPVKEKYQYLVEPKISNTNFHI